jgi:hypothetical protein
MISYDFTQVSPSATWNINHQLNNAYPNIDCYMIYGGSKQKLIPLSIVADNANNVTVTFSQAFAGYARVTA